MAHTSVIHVAGKPFKHKILCAHCGIVLYFHERNYELDYGEKAQAQYETFDRLNPKLAGMLSPERFARYPYKEGDQVIVGSGWRALVLSNHDKVPMCTDLMKES